MKNWKTFFFILLLLLSVFIKQEMHAQFADMKFEHLTLDKGLSNNRVQCILRDSKGYLWIGTTNGLNKFDGLKITVYKNDQFQSNSLSNNSIQCIFEDQLNNLWIGTYNGLNLFDRKKETFKRYISSIKDNTVENETFNRDNNIFSIIEDKSGNIWCSTENGLKKLNSENPTFSNFDLPVKMRNFQNQPIRFCMDKSGNFWLATQDAKLWRFKPKTQKFDNFTDESLASSLDCNKVIVIDSTGIIWLGTQGSGLYSYNPLTQKFKHYNTKGGGSGTYGRLIKDLFLDQNRFLYIAVDLGGINRLDLKTGSFEYCTMHEGLDNGLNSDAIWSIYKDMEDILYVGTSVSGLNINNSKRERFQTYRTEANNKNSLIFNVIFKFFEDSQGLIWIGTDGGGLSVFNRENKTFTNYKHSSDNPYSISGNAVNSFTEDKNHDIWIGTWGGGLNRFDRKTGRFYHFLPNPADPHAISDPNVWDLFTDSVGNIWISYNYNGTDVFNIQQGVIKKYRQNATDPNLFCPSNTNRFILQKNGEMGFATNKGYYILDRNTNNLRKIDCMEDYDLSDVYLDRNNNYWGGTLNNGLIIAKSDGTKERHNESNGFPSNAISGFLEDSQGNIWILTSVGLSEYLFRSKTFRHFSVADGLQGNQFMQFAYLKAKDGTFYLGGYNGFNVFSPGEIKINNYIPPVYIDEFQIFNEPVTVNTPNSPLELSISETKEITLSYEQSVFSFGFSAVNFTYPENAIYAYKMEGYDMKWNYTSANRRYTTYTNLDAGQYTFMVKASNNDGVWNETPTSIKIIITPPYWRTWWFKLIVAVIIIGSAISFYKYRINQYKNKKRLLELKVKERTAELQIANVILKENQEEILNQNDSIIKQRDILEMKNKELEEKNQEISEITSQLHEADQVKLRFFTNISHDLRTPLTLILGSLESVLPAVTNDKVLLDRLNIIRSNAQRLFRLVNQLLDFRKIDTETLKLQPEFHDIALFITNIFNVFRFRAENRNIDYKLIMGKDVLYTWFDPDKLDKILYNLLSNAFKFTPDGKKITIDVDFKNNKLKGEESLETVIIKVIDTGIGIHKKDLTKIFDRFYQAEHSYSRKYQGSGIGLALAKQLTEIHQGNISVKSQPGKGSCFEVVMAIGNSLQGTTMDSEKTTFIPLKETSQVQKEKSFGQVHPDVIEGSTMLIVEDNDDLRHFIVDELSNKFRVIEAHNGKEGMERTIRELPDLIISDVMMPIMDGFEMCEKIKLEWQTSHIPIIILTAKADEESFYHGLKIGADAYIRKPFEMKHLLIQIENLLTNRRKLLDKFNNNPLMDWEKLATNIGEKEFLGKVYRIIENHLADNNFGVESLADELNMSRSQLYKKVFSILNISAGELIRDVRLKKASFLLYDQRYAVSDVALMVGFADRPQFSRSFTNLFGISPKQYRVKGKIGSINQDPEQEEIDTIEI